MNRLNLSRMNLSNGCILKRRRLAHMFGKIEGVWGDEIASASRPNENSEGF